MKAVIILLVLSLSFALVGDAPAQSKISSHKIDRDQPTDLSKIFGYCGCTDCAGPLVHNSPMPEDQEFQNFFLGNRWTGTVLSGGGLGQGTPTMLTWSIVPDGTDTNNGPGFVPSNLIAVFDNIFNEPAAGSVDLSNRMWHGLMQQALDRWGEVSGIEYVYEPNDDGVTNFSFGGVLGVRGDVRIGGFNIDGVGGQFDTLAFNTFPNSGDMAIDTANTGLFTNPAFNFRLYRNVVTHEQGHGLGIFHLESNNAGFLMEPAISGSFDGPQLDDIRAAHRHYGDALEKSNNFQGNDTISNATDLGLLSEGGSVSIGLDGATGTLVSSIDDDFVSIDDNSDVDFFKIAFDDIGSVDITLTPVGASYNQSPEGQGGGNPIDPSASSNLTLTMFDSGGGLVALADQNGIGSAEAIVDQIVVPDDYFIRVTGAENTIQLYTLVVNFDSLDLPEATAPSSVTVDPGSVAAGGVGDLLISDNQSLELLPAVPANAGDDPLIATFVFTSPDLMPTSFTVSFEGAGNSSNLNQTISVFNRETFLFEDIDLRAVTFTDSSFTIDPGGNPQRFVDFPSGVVLMEVRYIPTGPVLLYPWSIDIDRLVINTN